MRQLGGLNYGATNVAEMQAFPATNVADVTRTLFCQQFCQQKAGSEGGDHCMLLLIRSNF